MKKPIQQIASVSLANLHFHVNGFRFSNIQKYLFGLFLLLSISIASLNGQISVTATAGNLGPTAYTTLKGAFDAINLGTHQGVITIAVTGNTTETAPAVLNASGTGSSSYTSVSIQPSGGASRTISGAITAGSPLIDFNGADNVTVDGLNSGGNTLTIENTTVSATSGTSTIRFIGGATSNTITNCLLKGAGTMSVATNGAIVFFSTDGSTTNGNDNNTISNCDIGPSGANLSTKAILGNGSTTTTAIGNSGIVINNNDIHDYFGAAVTSSGVAINGGCNTWSITNNRFYQTATRTWTTGAIHRAIDLNSTTASSGVQGMTVTGNIIGFASNTQTGVYTLTGSTGKFQGIDFNGITGGTVSNINSNTIASVSMTGVTSSGTSTSSPFQAIMVNNGVANTNSNTIGSQGATGSLTFSTTTTSATDVNGIFNFNVDDWTANSNTIGGISVTNLGASGTFLVFGMRANTSSSKVFNASSNIIGGTVANSIQLTSTGTSSQVVGMAETLAIATFSGNTIRNLTNNNGTGTTTSASVIGMAFSSTSVNNTVTQNTIFNLSNTNTTVATVVTGIQYNSSSGTNLIAQNLIHSLTTASSSSTAEVNGIRVSGGTATYRNNMIALGAGISNGSVVNGIIEAAGTNNFFHNSIYIGGSPTAGASNSFAFNSSVITNTRSYRDNIFMNARNNSGATGKNYAVQVGGTAPNPAGLTINNNLYYVTGSGAMFGRFNAADIADLPAWQVAVGQDAASFESDPQYLDPTNATPDLHLNASMTTYAEGNGVDVGVTDDYDGQLRASLTPVDIGADAGLFMGTDVTGPTISYVPLAGSCGGGGAQTLTTSITDSGSGVPTAGIGLPVAYYKINAGSYTASTGTYISGSTYTFSIGAGSVTGDMVSYYIVAQDAGGTPNISAFPSGGASGFSADPPAVSTPPTTPSSYTNLTALSGTYTVGAGGDYASLTAAIADYNSKCLSGAVVFSLTDASYTEAASMTINANAFASATNTLTIKPTQPNTTIAVTGGSSTAILILSGADYVILDGSVDNTANTVCPPSAASRDLTITNTNTGSSSAVVWLQTISGNGATNNTVMNCNLVGNSNTTTLFGVGSGSSTISTSSLGTGNNNNSFINNNISKTQYAIYSQGASAANKNAGNIINQNQINSVSPNNVAKGGIWVGFENNITISGNAVSEISQTSSPDVFGITLGFGTSVSATTSTGNEVTNATVTHNVVGNVKNSGTFSAVGIGLAAATSGTSLIANNMVYGVAANGTAGDFAAGIILGGGTGSTTNVYYNSVVMQGTITGASAATQTSACLAVTNSTGPTLDLRNNIFVNKQIGNTSATLKFVAIALGYSSYGALTSDNNDLFSAGPGPGTYHVGITGGVVSGTVRTTLMDWQTATGKDLASKNMSPVFVSSTDLHIVGSDPVNFPLENGAVTLGVTDDIDCETRMTDIGADEFEFTACTGAVAGTASVSGPSTFCASGSASITASGYSVDEGISYEWFKSSDNFVTNNMSTGQNDPSMFNTGTITTTTYYRLKVTCASNNAMDFSNIVTITINPLPVLTCPADFAVCVDASPINLTILTYNPIGGSFSGTGVVADIFTPAAAGPGPHLITYSYTDPNMCTNTCTFTITVNSLPIVTCPPSFTVCEADDPFALMGATPPGGTYSGAGVSMNQFDPFAATPGPHVITYTFTDGNMCSSTCNFTITVTPAYICASFMDWVLLPPGFENGSCVSETDCCEDILCYGLRYTPGTTGTLLDYTTGFTANCIGGASPIISNMSCTMTDNSFEINACMSDNLILFNSSGFDGMLPVMQGVPQILHKVCFSVPVGESLTIEEDTVTNLTTSIETPSSMLVVEFPQYDEFTITRTPPADPMDGSANVQCVESAVSPMTPVVLDQCGSPITPMLTSIMDNPDPLVCEGVRVYNYTYTDCSGFSVDWKFTYTIDHTINPGEVGGPVPTMDNVDGIANAVPPLLPVVADVCGHILSPMQVSVTDDPDPIICNGTRVYVYKWTDCSGLMFNWTFTYTINNVPVVNCPSNITVCAADAPFMLTGGTPPGGTYSGAGVTMNVFNPAAAGVGPHTITYTYTNEEGCPNTCTFQITVAPTPVVTCRPNASVCSFETPFVITGCNPPDGTFSGAGVTGNMFDPGAAGLGPHTITYTVTSMNGCSNTCSFVFNVTQCPGPPVIEIIPLDPCENAGDYGSCSFEGSCCDNILCFAIRYTPGYSGMLTSYTTGFFINCVGGLSPIVYNQSCVMDDNSFEAPMCEGGVILFNSSGNNGSLPITAGVPVILHRLCFMVPPGTSLNIIEDIITDLTCSIDLTGGGQVNEYPTYTPVTVTRTPPVVPMDGSATVACPDLATPPMPPAVFDQCCQPVIPMLTSVVDNPDPLTCEGTRVYTYTYTDCGGGTSEWHFTYTVQYQDFSLPPDDGLTVNCPDDTDVPPVPPIVMDNCGQLIIPSPPVVSPKPVCNGTRTYMYTYTDCALNQHVWTFTYTVSFSIALTPPPSEEMTVSCPNEAVDPGPPSPIFDACGQLVNAVLVGEEQTPDPVACNGTIVWRYRYTACDGITTADWTKTYNVIYSGGLIPPMSTTMTVSCPLDAINPGPPVPIMDACGRTVFPMFVGVEQTPDPVTCNGTIVWRYRYTACDGVTTVDWTKTYNVIYSGGLIPPISSEMTVSCPLDAVNPVPPAPIMDACGRTVNAVLVGVEQLPDPVTCNGIIVWRYRYTACDGVTTVDWTKTYIVQYSGGLIPPMSTTMTVSCPIEAVNPGPPAPIMDACGRMVTAQLVGVEEMPDPVTCNGTIVWRYRYTACDGVTTADWTKTYIIIYSGGLLPPPNDQMTVSCPVDAVNPGPPAPIMDACGRTVFPIFIGVEQTPDPVTCNGTIVWRYRYTACDGTTTADWTKTYNVIYSGGLIPPMSMTMTVSCPVDAVNPGPPAPIMDACGRTVFPLLVGVEQTPDPVTCNGTIVWRYRYTACDGTTTVDWTKTYNVIYSGGLIPPMSTTMTVSCPLDAINPGPPVPIMDACGRTVFPTFVGIEQTPDPVTCNGTIVWRYRYTACDNVTTADWTKTYNVIYSGELIPPMSTTMTVSCPADAVNPGPPANIMDACGRTVMPVFIGVEQMPDPVTCNGTIVFRYRYTACDNVTTADWTKTYNVLYSGGLNPPMSTTMTVSCPVDAVNPGPPANILDACGRTVMPVFIGVEEMPDPVTCNGTIVFRYRYTACDNVTTADWTKTYIIIYSGGLNPPMSTTMTVSCPVDAVNPGPPAPIMDACGRTVFPIFIGVEQTPDPVTCNGTIVWRYRYTACDGTTTADWTKTYNVIYSGGLIPPMSMTMTVSCPVDAVNPGPPAPIMDACGRTVFPLLVGVEQTPDPVTCNGTIVWRYRYTACDGTTTADWTKTYNVIYSGGLIPPMSTTMTVSCPEQAVNPGPPAPIMDACGRTVFPLLIGVEQTPDPVTCNGTIVWRYRYTACDNVTTADWTKTYNVIYSGGLIPPMSTTMTVSCPADAVNPGPPANIMDACGRTVMPVFIGVEQMPDPVTCNGTIVFRYRYTACDNVTTVDWTKTYTIIYSGGLLPPPNEQMSISCPAEAVDPGAPAPIFDACGRLVNAVLVGEEQTPDPVTCNGTIVWRYRYTACDGITTADWTKTYTIIYSGGLLPPPNDQMTVSCPAEAMDPGAPAPILDACGRLVNAVLVGEEQTPDPVACNGTIVWRYRYTACDGITTADWTKTYTIIYSGGLMPPLSQEMEVSCPAQAVDPGAPAPILDACGRMVNAVLVGEEQTPDPVTCNGTIVWRYRYTACDNLTTADWTKTYIINGVDFIVPMDGSGTVACPAQATAAGVILPVVLSNCGDPLMPGEPTQDYFETDTYDGCDGTISFTWIYVDCEGNSHPWTYTYTIERNDFTVPMDDGATVPFAIFANPNLVMLPMVFSDCGELLTPSTPIQDYFETDTYNGCEGTISFTWFYTDCAMHTHAWTFTFTVIRPDFMLPVQFGAGTVPCPLLAIAANVILPNVFDADGVPLMPGPALQNYFGTDTFNGFEGTISFTWFFTDCAMHTHPYTYTYTVTCALPTEIGGPVPTSSTINCYLDAAPPAILPLIVDGCDSTLTPTGPVIGGTNTGNCGGTITYSYTYSNCEGVPYVWVYTYNVSCDPIHLKVWLEGAYSIPGDSMATTINQLHRLPGQLNGPFIFDAPPGQPYTVAPWNYSGNLGTQYGDGMGQTPYPPDVVDWVLVTIRKNGLMPTDDVWTCAGWVLKNGDVTFPENCPLPAFTTTDTYYYLVQHRHHLGILSPSDVDMPCGTAILEWDFRNSNSYQPVFRFGQKEVEPGVWAMFTGNGEQINSIAAINSFDRTLWKVWQGFSGYNPGDYIMDGFTDSFDETAWKNNQNRTSGVVFY